VALVQPRSRGHSFPGQKSLFVSDRSWVDEPFSLAYRPFHKDIAGKTLAASFLQRLSAELSTFSIDPG
jgi:hypothetical protein